MRIRTGTFPLRLSSIRPPPPHSLFLRALVWFARVSESTSVRAGATPQTGIQTESTNLRDLTKVARQYKKSKQAANSELRCVHDDLVLLLPTLSSLPPPSHAFLPISIRREPLERAETLNSKKYKGCHRTTTTPPSSTKKKTMTTVWIKRCAEWIGSEAHKNISQRIRPDNARIVYESQTCRTPATSRVSTRP